MVNKGEKMNYKSLQKGDRITFVYISGFTGEQIDVDGIIIGYTKDVKAMWPDEMGGLTGDEDCYLVRRKDSFGNTFHHCVWPEEILAVRDHIKIKKED